MFRERKQDLAAGMVMHVEGKDLCRGKGIVQPLARFQHAAQLVDIPRPDDCLKTALLSPSLDL
jgi:hypothetical protein